jgi:DNA modification methylase
MTPHRMARCMELWPIDRLIPYARNARTHSDAQIAQIAASIREFGFNSPILVDSHAGIIAGHARLLAARKLQLSEVPVVVLDHLSQTEKRAYILVDNRLAENAGWDDQMLRLELAALREEELTFDLLGFDAEELTRLLADEEAVGGLTDEDAVPELPKTPVSAPGDLWVLNNTHRVFCGDATVCADVERLMSGDAADLVFTDPPYGVNYQGYTDQHLKLQGDHMNPEQFRQFLSDTFRSYRRIVKPEASLYVCHSSSWQREFQNALEAAGFAMRCQLIWAKNTFAWGFGRYKFQHEPIFYAYVAGQKDPWYGDKSQSTLWEENKPAANRIHPTSKPVELVERALVNSSRVGDLVVDLFGGSGSTLIGCERKGRQARLMEIDPQYTDCMVRRWQEYTGQQGVLQRDGRCFDEIRQQRLKKEA